MKKGETFKKIAKWSIMAGACFVMIRILFIVYPMFTPSVIPEVLPNGFRYIDSLNVNDGKVIADAEGNVIIPEYVRRFRWDGDIVYGKREEIYKWGRRYSYFICTYGESCEHTQSYTPEDFNLTIEIRKHLPPLDTPLPYEEASSLQFKGILKRLKDEMFTPVVDGVHYLVDTVKRIIN